ncbi:MAG TPA: DUF5996 family protein [Candidatus Tumulicola sp.]
MNERIAAWPELPLDAWRATCDTLHRYAQIVGKVRLALSPPEPEWAHVAMYVTPRGLWTGPIPYGDRSFSIEFDFVEHRVRVAVSDGSERILPLVPRAVADFYREFMDLLAQLGIDVRIWDVPVELPDKLPFDQDVEHRSYDPEYASRYMQVLRQVDAALKEHRAPFRLRHTQVQFFFGSFDLAYARYSGRPAEPPSNDIIMRLAMDAQEICTGFWPGDDRFPEPAFWCYAYPKPDGIESAKIGPSAAAWDPKLGEFVLRYADVRASADPRAALREFLTSTYDALAKLADWPEEPPK